MRGLLVVASLLGLPLVVPGVSGAQGALAWCQGPSGACYSIHQARLPFQRAQAACAEDGGTLSTARGPTETRALLALLGRVSNASGASFFWLGLVRKAQQCTLEDRPLRGFSWDPPPPPPPPPPGAPGDNETARWVREPSKSCTLERCAGLEVRLGQPRLEPWGLREHPCSKESPGYICKYSYVGACPGVHPNLGSLSHRRRRLLLYRLPFSRLPSATALEFSPPGTELTLRCPLGREERFTCRLSPDGGSYWEGTEERLCSCPTGYWSPAEGACVEADHCLGAHGGFLCLCSSRGFRLGADPVSCLRDVETHSTAAEPSLPPVPSESGTGQPLNTTAQLGANPTFEDSIPTGAGNESTLEKASSADSSNYVFILITVAVVMLVILIMAALQVFQVCFRMCSSTKATSQQTLKDDGATTVAPLKSDLEASATRTDSENSLGPSKAESQESSPDEPQPGGGQEEPERPCV